MKNTITKTTEFISGAVTISCIIAAIAAAVLGNISVALLALLLGAMTGTLLVRNIVTEKNDTKSVWA